MNKTIDLHGLTEIDATGIILSALIELEEGYVDYIEFITGRGYVLTRVLEDLIDESKFRYEKDLYNPGIYRVY
ncbi:MAG: hypothetical protein HRT99_02745 [Mycoplasmatales bacterium]|nr:hypothetical protein [Mycoplasmatales bacterium]